MVVIAWIIRILLILVSSGLVVLVTMQKAKQAGLGSLAGGDSFSLKGKSKGKEAALNKFTWIGMIVFVVLSIALAVIAKTM